jgi:phosphoglucosamine mutase
VGDRYVLEEMKRKEAMIGGEQSGHIIYFDRNTTGDGLITSLTVLETMNHFQKRLSALINDIPRFPQVLKNIRIRDKEKIMEAAELSDALDRARDILKNTGRILVRPSGTEPLIRIMIEGNNEEQITQLANELLATVEGLDA